LDTSNAILLAGGAAMVMAFLALIMARFAAGFTRKNGPLMAGIAGGIVVTIALLHLIPEAFHMSPQAAWIVLAGFGLGFLIHGIADSGSGSSVSKLSALAPLLAIGMHSALDGLVYAVSFQVEFELGLNAAVGLVLHEFPEAIICFVLLQRAGIGDRLAFLLAFLVSGALTFAASAMSLPYTSALDEATLGAMFAFVAGLLLHVGASHLLHEAQSVGFVKSTSSGLIGALIGAVMSLGHGSHHHGGPDHGHESHDHRSHEDETHQTDHAHSDHEASHETPDEAHAHDEHEHDDHDGHAHDEDDDHGHDYDHHDGPHSDSNH
jgi:ZIP family zinc transporter